MNRHFKQPFSAADSVLEICYIAEAYVNVMTKEVLQCFSGDWYKIDV